MVSVMALARLHLICIVKVGYCRLHFFHKGEVVLFRIPFVYKGKFPQPSATFIGRTSLETDLLLPKSFEKYQNC